MAHKEPPAIKYLFDKIAAQLPQAIEVNETIVRSVGTLYANEADFLSGRGAGRVGGRWNRPGIRAVYASLDIITATYEAYQNFIEYGLPLSSIRPRVTAGANAKLSQVLDLTNKAILRSIGFSLRRLLDEDWRGIQEGGNESTTQIIGRGCRRAGFEGLLVFSARHPGGKNIVIFPDKLLDDSSLDLLSPNEFPPHPHDWLI